jgi:TRAP-type mannitol/chloroaromatic compound transport system substrate-binding protein
MDRRDFLRTTGAAAVTAGAAATPAAAETVAAPAIATGAQALLLASTWGAALPGEGAERLAHRIETATGGRYRIAVAAGGDEAELTYGSAHRHARLHPAFALFAGLPAGQGLDAAGLQTWLAVGGGEMLWDDLAGEFRLKMLTVGHTGPSAGIWASARLEASTDLAGARLHVEGLAAEVVRALGGTPVEMSAPDLKAALAGGRIQAAEWLGPLAAAAPDLQPLAERLYEPGLNRGGVMLSLSVARHVWDGMSPADRAIFEACAAQEYQLSLADAWAHAMVAAEVAGPAKWPVRIPLSPQLTATVERAAEVAVERVAATDPVARRIHDSYRAFRHMLGEAVTA